MKKILGIAVILVMAMSLFSCGSEDDFDIKDGRLNGYSGTEKSITIPEDVTEIYENALSSDYDNGVNLEEVIVPGTVKHIFPRAFAFTAAKKIIIEEGVKTIGDEAFMDSYIDEIWFPASLTEIGDNIMGTEEGLRGCKIHVTKGSTVAKYFEKKMPYGDAKLVYE